MRKFNKFLFCSLAILVLCGSTIYAQVIDRFSLQQSNILFNNNGVYDEIYIENCSFTEDVGKPKIPVFTQMYVLPYGAEVIDIQVSATNKQQPIAGNFYIIPAQPPQKLDGSEPPPFVEPDLSVYSSSLPYPNKTVEIVDNGYIHGYHVVTVKIYPISYIPASGEIYLNNYDFTINYTISNRSNSEKQALQSLRMAELTKQFVQSMVKNTSDVENCRNQNVQIVYNKGTQFVMDSTRGGSTSAIDTLVPDYIIITNNALKPTFQQLADWKIKKGVPAFIKTEPNYI